MSKNTRISAKSNKKQQRKKLIENYKPSADQLRKEEDLFNSLVVDKAEYYDELSAPDSILPDKNIS